MKNFLIDVFAVTVAIAVAVILITVLMIVSICAVFEACDNYMKKIMQVEDVYEDIYERG